MGVAIKNLLDLTAEDLMTQDVVRLPAGMPLRDAAHLLLRNQVAGAPVVDARGRCVGVFSAIDFLRLAETRPDVTRLAPPPLPVTCPFQKTQPGPGGAEIALCTLPPGVCPVQVKKRGPGEEESLVCGQPRCVLADWQVVELEKLPADEVSRFMTADPVTARADTSIRTLARMMVDAHLHRVIVVDEEGRPVGVVSSTDLLAALAYAGGEPAPAQLLGEEFRGERG